MKQSQFTLGELLRTARSRANLTVRELGAVANVASSYITKLELDQKTNPSPDILLRLADALELDAGVLLGYIGVEPASVLPSMSVVLRGKYQLTEAEAREAAREIEERYGTIRR